ncbi:MULTISPECIES: glycosyltransferase family 2 protein [Brenneria]|uniref:Glycosyltransferase family 2 protein n=1 Tax=Brenneria nigrifluens DSM 30175 = ATCC 13028 TaxID=1121120 RepID=A0A2U1UG83_9GAMM|nr:MULTISPECIES: glycosyltransferase family 2 protein [Brenneria]EHD23774.1 glycosyl transferase family 2 [Brenneria sp. EniD312]PWC20584.1 glycosyltransferase family 2 protein [Brenneria nigrifluens DSM 30175 = ATCC 13028]QCR06686.1 glycosyltransferase family 2 protein [Brenneria nigrifluens DSM 30175 = ATCC 13028]
MSVNGQFSPCVVIPCYNHGAMMRDVMARLAALSLPIFIVDDGSAAPTQRVLEQLAAENDGVVLLRLAQNGGKGAAVIRGLEAAAQAGYSHALQVDADGQHRIEDAPRLLAQAKRYPDHLISGRPVYDESVPKSRLYGRYITHIWVWIETLSLSLQDSMCGFRVYPVDAALSLIARHPVGRRMDFDTEIMVRLYWAGTPSRFVETAVIYPHNGLSHFDALRDNLRISRMHARLFFGMLPRIPALLKRRRQTHWSSVGERKGLLGMRFMLAVYRLLGRGAFTLFLWPVIAFYWLTGRAQRQASQAWLRQVTDYARRHEVVLPKPLNSYRHFLRFGQAMLDKIASWRGDLRWGKEIDFAPGARETIERGRQRGQLILASHLGDIEVCRALAQQVSGLAINALVFTENSQRFKRLLEEIAPQAGVNLIPVSDIGPDTAILLQQKLDAGEWVAIVGDRTAVNRQRGGTRRVVWSRFLGREAPFPQGPFVLAAALRCPVLLMFVLREGRTLSVYCEPFADPLALPRDARQQALQQAVDRYAERLAHYALKSPLDWFNFFDFWSLPDNRPAAGKKE